MSRQSGFIDTVRNDLLSSIEDGSLYIPEEEYEKMSKTRQRAVLDNYLDHSKVMIESFFSYLNRISQERGQRDKLDLVRDFLFGEEQEQMGIIYYFQPNQTSPRGVVILENFMDEELLLFDPVTESMTKGNMISDEKSGKSLFISEDGEERVLEDESPKKPVFSHVQRHIDPEDESTIIMPGLKPRDLFDKKYLIVEFGVEEEFYLSAPLCNNWKKDEG